MKYLFLFLICIVTITRAYSQSLHFYSGAKIEDNDGESFQLLDQDSLYLYSFHHKRQNYFVAVYEKDSLNRISLIKVPLPSKDTIKHNLESLFIRNDTFQIFYSYFDKKNSSEKLEMITFNKSGEKIGETKLIDKSEGKNEKKAGGFSVINRKRFNEFLSYGFISLKDTPYINIDHFDYWGNKIRSQYFLLDNNSGYIVHSFIGDNSNLYHLTKSKWEGSNINWSVRIYSPDSNHPQILELKQPSSEKIYLSNFFKSYIDIQGRYNLLSPYTLSPSSQYAKGIYIAQIDSKTNTLIKESVIPFKVRKDNSNDEKDFSLSACIIEGIIPMSNNSLKIVFESRLQTTNSLYGIPVEKEYDMGNIITVDMDSNNVVTEIHSIKKQQHTGKTDYKFTGFAILNHDNKSYFIYNELPDNLQRTPDKMKKVTPARLYETVVIYTVVDSGKVRRKILIDKAPNSGIDAVLPSLYLSSITKNEIYMLRKIKADTYITKIFIND